MIISKAKIIGKSKVAKRFILSAFLVATSSASAVEFENEETFREKVKTIRESYFNDGKPATTVVTEDVEVDAPSVEGTMGAYVNALSRWAKWL